MNVKFPLTKRDEVFIGLAVFIVVYVSMRYNCFAFYTTGIFVGIEQ